LLGFDSEFQQYTNGSALGVLFQSASCVCPGRASGRGWKSRILENVTFTLDTDPPTPAPPRETRRTREPRAIYGLTLWSVRENGVPNAVTPPKVSQRRAQPCAAVRRRIDMQDRRHLLLHTFHAKPLRAHEPGSPAHTKEQPVMLTHTPPWCACALSYARISNSNFKFVSAHPQNGRHLLLHTFQAKPFRAHGPGKHAHTKEQLVTLTPLPPW
jgi:hypothetical protein